MDARRILAFSSATAWLAVSAVACSGGESGALRGDVTPDAGTEPVPEPEDPTEEEPVPHDCVDVELGSALPVDVRGTTTGRGDDFRTPDTAACPGAATGPDVAYAWTAPRAGTFVFSTAGSSYFARVSLYASCTAAPLVCGESIESDGDDVPLVRGAVARATLEAGRRVIVVVDGDGAERGDFRLSIRAAEDERGRCDDGVDDDGDGLVDCADPDCATEPRCVEDGTNCANGVDDDGDGLVDCADPDCEAVVDAVLDGPLPIEVRGDTTGQGNDYVLGPPTCSESPVNRGDDVAYSFTAPSAGTYRFASFTSEADPFGVVLRIARPECGAPEIACQAYDVRPGVDVALAAGQTVVVVVDPFTTGTATGGPYVLRVERAP